MKEGMKMNRFTYKIGIIAMIFSIIAYTQFSTQTYAQNEDYKKWGKIAVDVAKLNYTDSQISDYDYKGRKVISETEAQDTFELQIKDENRTFTAIVNVKFNPKTNLLTSVTLKETR